MKICFVCKYAGLPQKSGGAERQALLLAEVLRDDGYDMSFVSIAEPGKAFGSGTPVKENGFEIHRLRGIRLMAKLGGLHGIHIALYHSLKKALCMIRPDVVYQRTGNAFTGYCAYLKEYLGYRFIWAAAHDMDFETTFHGKIPNICFRILSEKIRDYGIKRADSVVVQTEYQAAALRSFFGKFPNVVYNAIKVDISPCPLNDRENLIVWIGNINEIKNPAAFIRLAESMKEEPYRFIMIGDRARDVRKLRYILKKAEEIKDLTLTGRLERSEVEMYLSKAKLLVHTAFKEGFPNVFLEAWALGVPVASLHVDPDGIFRKYGVGILAKSEEDLRHIVKMIMADEDRRMAMAYKGIELVKEEFSMEKNHANFKKILTEIANG